ncbi:fungal-specific transcription factor domain-containing protein, partial [Podospora aff. communis PSN243]
MESSTSAFIPESGQPSQRRRKVRLACNPCRARKTGCDGKKPVCTACALRGWDERCQWQDSVMPTSSALSLADLDRRLQRLESGGTLLQVPDSALHRDSTASSQEAQSDQTDNEDRAALPHRSASPAEPPQTFMHLAADVADKTTSASDSAQQQTPKGDWPDFFGYHVDMLELPSNVFDRQFIALPLQHFADELLQVYWRQIHTIYPFLHWPTFMADYSKLWDPNTPAESPNLVFEEVVFHATLNMALALGCQTSESMSLAQRQYQANEFYKRSQRLVSIETLDVSSISVVQLLLLRVLYLYYASLADRCWIMLGAAYRVAVSVGLHASQPRKGDSQLEREMKARLWHFGLAVLEHSTSSAFARPPMVSNQVMTGPPFPQSIDDEYLSATEEGRQPDALPARVAMNVFWARTAAIIEDMRAMRATSHGSSKVSPAANLFGPDPGAILRLNSRIEDVLRDMPYHLRPDADYTSLGLSEEQAAVFRYQGRVLRTRSLLLRILLLRPSLLAQAQSRVSLRRPSASSAAQLEERFQTEISDMCISTARAALEEMNQHLGTAMEYPGWYALQLSFNAAVILIVASICPTFNAGFDLESTRLAWDRAIRIMERHREKFPSAGRGLQVLHGFRNHVASRPAARNNSFGTGVDSSLHQQMH